MNPRLTRTKREVKRLIKLAEREAKRCVDNPTLSTSLAVDSAGDAFEAIKTYLKEKGAADVVSAEFEAKAKSEEIKQQAYNFVNSLYGFSAADVVAHVRPAHASPPAE